MGLRDYRPRTEVVTFPGAESQMTVRGLSLADITPMVARKAELIEELYGLFGTMQLELVAPNVIPGFIARLIVDAPELVAEVISVAADEPEMAPLAARLPINTQADALTKIANLTFDEMGGVKNLFAVLAEQIRTSLNLPLSARTAPAPQIPLRQ